MQAHKQVQQQGKRLALFAMALLTTASTPLLSCLNLTAQASVVTAKQANSFVDSICVNTHLTYLDTPYGNYSVIKDKLVELGVRHIRDAGSSSDFIRKMKELAGLGIKTTFIIQPKWVGVVPNTSYWSDAPHYTINDFLKNKVGPNVIDAVEINNEIDLNYPMYKWHPNDSQPLNNDPNSSLYWAKYARSMTIDTWNALKRDSATSYVKVAGPSLGRWLNYGVPNPLGDLRAYVDWGNMHSYPFGGDSYGDYFSYNTLRYYNVDANYPSNNISEENPHVLDVYSAPYAGKPMISTETGYFTTSGDNGVNERVQAKYMPRLFLEYYRRGIVRTCSYEFIDMKNDRNNQHHNFGLLRNNLSPKPAYTALKNVINTLKDPGSGFSTSSLDYKMTVTPPSGYNRTQYVHQMLLQKRDGKFYLVVWHEISNGDILPTPVREIFPPTMPTKITFTTPMNSSVVIKTLDDAGNMSSSNASISNNSLNLNVTDKVMIVQLTRK